MNSRQYLEPLFSPSSIAIVGASTQPEKIGNIVLRNLIEAGFEGKIFPVHPAGGNICGLAALSKLEDLPAEFRPLDLAVICLPGPKVAQALEELGKISTKAAVIITAGFKEVGGKGPILEAEIKEIAEKNNILLLGPNCLGIINTRSKVDVTFAVGQPIAGHVSFFSQSGALCVAILDWAKEENIGFSSFVSLGNKAMLDESDILAYMGEDPDTKVILGYLESIENGPRFLQTAQHVTRNKPIILLRAGRTAAGAKAASSHTGAMAGADMAYEAAFKQCGIIRATKMEDLFSLAQAFSSQPLPKGTGLAIITNSGGPGIVAADSCETSGLKLAEFSTETIEKLKEVLPSYAAFFNPVDTVGDAREDRIAATIETVLKDSAVHAMLVVLAPTARTPVTEVAKAILPIIQAQKKPVFCCIMGGNEVMEAKHILTQAGIPCYSFPEPAIEAIASMHKYHLWKEIPLPIEVCYRRDLNRAEKIIAQARAANTINMVEFQTQELLKAYEIPMLEAKLARTSDEAVQIAKQFAQPVALKIASPQILHKTDVGGVALNLKTPQEIRDAFMRITSQTARLQPDAYIAGCLVQVMAPKDARETIIGFKRDDRFGPLMLFGLGGIHVEALKDISFRLAPLSLFDVHSMVREIRSFPILAGMRGQKAVQFNALEDILLIMSQMAMDFPEIQEAECNPVLASEQGAVVADMRVVLAPLGKE